MKECKSSPIVTTLTETAQKITNWFKRLFPGVNDNAEGKLPELTGALNELKTSLESHKLLLDSDPTASAATPAATPAAPATASDDDDTPDATPANETKIKAQINAKLKEILDLIKKPEQPVEQSEENSVDQPNQPVKQPKQPDEITDLISFIKKLKDDHYTEGKEITAEELNPHIEKLETLISEITNEDGT